MGGAKIQLVIADDASQPARTASEARRLITQDDVSMIVGTLLSAQMLAISPVVDEYKVPTLAMWAGGARASYLYSLGFPYDRGYAKTMADFAGALGNYNRKINTAVIACSNYEAGQQVTKYLQQMLPERGIKVIAEVPLDTQAQDHTASMLRIRSLKPDAVIGLMQPREGILLMQARYGMNYHDSIFIGNSPYSDQVIWRELGPDIGKAVLTRNLFGMASYSEGAKIASMQELASELRSKGNLKSEVGQATIQAAQAARIMQQVLELAGSTEREAINQALKKVNIPYGDPNLYLARAEGLAFGEDRMPKDSTSMMVQWSADRKLEVVWPDLYAQTKPRV
jgi:ABC-type branched-subunit amino acid transport system substrate-binding protein